MHHLYPDTNYWISKQYALGSSNTTLRGHFDDHAQLYLEQADANHWPVKNKFAELAFTLGYTMKTLREAVAMPGVNIYALLSMPPRGPSDCPPMDITLWKGVLGTDLPEFSLNGLHPIARGREVVCTVRKSGQCHSNFQQTIKSGNEQEWFINQSGQPITLPVVELLHNVKTRWDSSYLMMNHLHAL